MPSLVSNARVREKNMTSTPCLEQADGYGATGAPGARRSPLAKILARSRLESAPPAPDPPATDRDVIQTAARVSGTLSPVPPWDQTEADRLLADLRAAVTRARQEFGGPFPADLQAVVADGIAIAEGYVANHEAEARRGWDALQLLRKVKPRLLATVARVKGTPAAQGAGLPGGR
jgi:hypothetical protein